MAHNLPSVFSASNDPAIIRVLTRQETEGLATILTLHQRQRDRVPFCKGRDLAKSDLFAGETSGLLMIMIKRLEVLTPDYEYDPLTVVFLASLVDRPAVAVMFAYSLALETKQRGVTIDPAIMAQFMVPWGVPSDAHLHQCWDAQKGLKTSDGREWDNYIDTGEAWAWV